MLYNKFCTFLLSATRGFAIFDFATHGKPFFGWIGHINKAANVAEAFATYHLK
jgi:hypothetical protein